MILQVIYLNSIVSFYTAAFSTVSCLIHSLIANMNVLLLYNFPNNLSHWPIHHPLKNNRQTSSVPFSYVANLNKIKILFLSNLINSMCSLHKILPYKYKWIKISSHPYLQPLSKKRSALRNFNHESAKQHQSLLF